MTKPSLRFLAPVLLTVLLATSYAAAQARVLLSSVRGVFIQTSNTPWTLSKTGAQNTTNSTVTWRITATQGSTVSNRLAVDGFLAITNLGSAGATIGNIVVNLQAKSGAKWVTVSSDVAE